MELNDIDVPIIRFTLFFHPLGGKIKKGEETFLHFGVPFTPIAAEDGCTSVMQETIATIGIEQRGHAAGKPFWCDVQLLRPALYPGMFWLNTGIDHTGLAPCLQTVSLFK